MAEAAEPERRVIIAHEDGRRYSVTLAGYRALYEPEGFVIERYEDGAPYDASAPGAPAVGNVEAGR